MNELLDQILANIRPYVMSWVEQVTQEAGGGAGVHELAGPLHTGELADSQAPQFLKRDGARSLIGDLAVADGIKIDGIDISAHAADPNAHHNQVHALAGSDHTASGLSVGQVVRATGATTFGWQTLQHNDLGGVTADQHHNRQHGITSAADHTVSGSAWDVVGLSAANTLGILQSSSNPGAAERLLRTTVNGYLRLLRLGLGVDPGYPLHVAGAGTQMRIERNGSNYADLIVGDTGQLNITPTGNLMLNPAGAAIFDPTGNDVRPENNYDLNLGLINKKWLTLHAAELWVETLVAQETIATIGGRILVGPTTTLVRDLDVSDSNIYVKHNQIAAGFDGNVIYLEANGKVEFMRATSGPFSETDGYRYAVVRDLDGSGANEWYAGDAVFNTGSTGDGWMDLYSIRGVYSTGYGPAIAGNVRTGITFNAWVEHWAIGNLRGLYGYGSNAMGVAGGRYDDGYAWFAIDSANGMRIMRGRTSPEQLARWAIDGTITVGRVASGQSNIVISAGEIKIRNNTTDVIRLGSSPDAAGLYAFFERPVGLSATNGGLYQGTGTWGSPTTGLKLWNSSGTGKLSAFDDGVEYMYINPTGIWLLHAVGSPLPGSLLKWFRTTNGNVMATIGSASSSGALGNLILRALNSDNGSPLASLSLWGTSSSTGEASINATNIALGGNLFTNVYRARVWRNANQSIPNNTTTKVQFTTEIHDAGNLFELVSSSTRLTAPVAGWYTIIFSAAFAPNGTGRRFLAINRNNATIIALTQGIGDATHEYRDVVATQYYLNAGDYVEAEVNQGSGGNLNLVTYSEWSPVFMMARDSFLNF